jgi:hypothetical protein
VRQGGVLSVADSAISKALTATFSCMLWFAAAPTISHNQRIRPNSMKIETRETALPAEMQGEWYVEGEPNSILVVDGGEVMCFGAIINYDYKEVDVIEGAITVSLKINDEAQEDTFSRANIIGLVISPEGDFLGYNTKFSVQFLRKE